LPGQRTGPAEHRCDRQLVHMGDDWQVSHLA
jgi:ATP phosphoribosyltransferase regulatory subunit